MYIKIYFGEAVILIHDEKNTAAIPFDKKVIFTEIVQPGKKKLITLQNSFHFEMEENYSFKVKDVDVFFKIFSMAYTSIEAAGGIVQDKNKDLLFIHRLGKWDLPKGKIESGETPAIAAQREITEETGVENLTLVESICKTYHIYDAFGKRFLKATHWFQFLSTGTSKLVAQTEENISEVKWIPTINIKTPVENTYQNVRDVLSTFFDKP